MIAFGLRFALIIIVLGALVATLSILAPTLPQPLVDAYAWVATNISQLGFFLPLDTLKQILVAVVGFWFVVLTYDLWNWMFKTTSGVQ